MIKKVLDLAGKFREPLRIFLLVGFFLLALDSCIAVNRWWFEEDKPITFLIYLCNLFFMVLGFAFFTILASKSKLETVGFIFFCIAVYFICNYEIGGGSKYYLTPFDPLFGLPKYFTADYPYSYFYRKIMAYVMSILSASFLSASRLKHINKK
jgi:hypothetical protein